MAQKIEKFEDLNIWKEGMRLSITIHEALKECRDFGIKDQMQRASVSVPSNIAEGFERNSNKEVYSIPLYCKGFSRGTAYSTVLMPGIEVNRKREM